MRAFRFGAEGLLLITAIIWGLAFVAQRVGMDHLGPYSFNAARFALGTLSLLPLTRIFAPAFNPDEPRSRGIMLWGGGLLLGVLLFAGSSLQQIGLVTTTAGKAGFITGLYLIFVPMIGLFWSVRTTAGTWLGALLALWGLYLLSISGDLSIASGDLYVLVGAIFWALHVLAIGWLSPRTDALRLSIVQFGVCALLSLIVAVPLENPQLNQLIDGWVPIAYAGVFSVGIAYTLQVFGQKQTPPARAAIILSLEAVFAVVGGWAMLHELLGPRELLGCALMLAGMLLSQVNLPQILPVRMRRASR